LIYFSIKCFKELFYLVGAKDLSLALKSNNNNNSELSNTDDIIQIDKRTTIVNPIPELITFIKETHNTDVEKRINEYVDEINKKEEE